MILQVQRLYYRIEKLSITCPYDFDFDDLERNAYVDAAFSTNEFINIIKPPLSECEPSDPYCHYSGVETIDTVEGYDVCNAELYINRFVDVPVHLKCLETDGYGRKTANKLIKALDEYFETMVSPVLEEKIYEQAPTGFVYNLVSPYNSDRKYCAHGAYYAGGNLVNQIPDEDGVLITKFTYGFDVIWYKPREFEDELLPDVESIINEIFEDGDFLLFLQETHPEYDFVQDIEFCDVVDPGVTFPPTEEPTPSPTEGPVCDIDTNDGCRNGQVCRLSCVYSSDEPQCFDDEIGRDCSDKYGLGWVCRDSNGDGIVDGDDHGNGCELTAEPSRSPTESPSTAYPTPAPSTMEPSPSPTLRPVTSSPTISSAPTFNTWPSDSPSLSSSPSDLPTLAPTTSSPTDLPSPVPTYGGSDTQGGEETVAPTPVQTRPAVTFPPSPSPVDYPENTDRPTCPLCIIHPDDTEEDECPLVTSGTCGGGNRGDGICPYDGHCCSKWGYCGTTPEYCESDAAPSPSVVEGAPPAPTYSVDAGMCAGGDLGDGFCADESLCCSDWGYCGEGEAYCFTTRYYKGDGEEDSDGTCGGGGIGDGLCATGLCCSQFGFCGEGDLYCTGQKTLKSDDVEEGEKAIKSSPLPNNLKPEFGFRCGISEVDARGNCKKQCNHHVQCSDGEECWGVQLNYCNTFAEGDHPVCTDLDLADEDSRCGFDEASARGHCGQKCTSDDECGELEFCFPTMLNLCECHGETCPEEAEIAFAKAKQLISPYFVQNDPNESVEGKPRSASITFGMSVATSFLLGLASIIAALS